MMTGSKGFPKGTGRKFSGRAKGWLKAGVLAACLAAVCGPVIKAYGAVYVYEDEEDWEDEEEERASSRRAREEEDDGNGPGAGMETDSVILEGPSVDLIPLKEQYHEDYQVYEESLADRFFFYSSVGNGGITHESVILDIPQNLTYTIEVNGVPWEYVPGQPISAYGTYVILLTGIEDSTLPLSEQKEYQAVFRFRIQAKPPKKETEEESKEAASGGIQWKSFAYDGQPIEESSESVFAGSEGILVEDGERLRTGEGLGDTPGEGGQPEGYGNGESQPDPAGSEGSLEGGEVLEGAEGGMKPEEGLEGEGTLADPDGGLSSDAGKEEGFQGEGGGHVGYRPRTQSYDSGLGKYQVTFPDGQTLFSSVPEGYVGAGGVEINAPDGKDGEVLLYRDDELVEHSGAISLTEPGQYRIELSGQPFSCTIAPYLNRDYVYAAPCGMAFVSATLDGEPISLDSERYVLMDKDGAYQFVLEGETGDSLTAGIIRDTAPPEVQVTVKGGTAAIQYLSEDIEEIRLEKDGKIQEGFSGYAVSSPGTYRLTVSDHGGNETSRQFTLTYKVNRYGVFAVALVILLGIGGVVFVIYTKKNVKIR